MACLKLDAEGRTAMLDDALQIPSTLISTGFEAWRRGCKDISLDKLSMPATVIATDDPFLPAPFLEQAVVARLPRARLDYVPGAGHYPQMELPERIASRLRHAFR
ncbi:MAG: alpha/beta hydrolase [Proteobacteria bacterium]|nr:alpha/beta hydrolase [Pseudomonadota bacterium]